MAAPEENRTVVTSFWDAMYRGNWESFCAHFTPEAVYTDASTPEDEFATGPSEILARLRLAFDPLESVRDERTFMVADEGAVVTEHIEHWRWKTGETMALPVLTMHKLRDGLIWRWVDYWDMQTLVQAAPPAWFEHVLTGYK